MLFRQVLKKKKRGWKNEFISLTGRKILVAGNQSLALKSSNRSYFNQLRW